jgi:hypothetical protein
VALGLKRGLRLDSVGMEQNCFFSPSVKRFVKGLETGISVHRWLQWENLEGWEGSFTRDFERQVIIWSSSTP